MAQRLLTKEQIEKLRQSPHVCYVTEVNISFTAEFKQHFYEEYTRGKTTRSILREAGIDPDWMGNTRIYSLRTVVQAQAKKKSSFTDKYRRLPPSPDAPKPTNDERIARLEHELSYTKQELEFLKKIYLADREAGRAWSLKHRRIQNSESSEK